MTTSPRNPQIPPPAAVPAAGSFPTCDLFCRVIDNFGDAGVCWRLARRLLALGVGSVRLITDNPQVLALLAPEAETVLSVRPWDEFAQEAAGADFVPAELVIETFGCRLPETYEQALAARRAAALAAGRRPPFYFNLDYLSAEDWVEESHDIVGLHPRLDLPKTWFFPGFTRRTGGVVIEDGLEEARQAFRSEQKTDFLSGLGADPGRPTLFVFCYPVNPVGTIARALGLTQDAWNVLIAPGAAGDALETAIRTDPAASERVRSVRAPFVPQTGFDRLLWASDAAVVRGEDSFVRAQLAGLPLLWSTYPTEDHAHRIKLDAWLARFAPHLGGLQADYVAWSDAWLEGGIRAEAFAAFLNAAPRLAAGADAWRRRLLLNGDLGRTMLERAARG